MKQYSQPDPDAVAGSPIERLLQSARSAAELRHRLVMLDIEAQHRLAWYHAWYHSHYNPNQPRVPAGHPDGGQWTSEGSSKVAASEGRTLSDAIPDNDWMPDAQYASSRGRGSGRVQIGGQSVEASPAQLARFEWAIARAQDAIRRAREIDPTWQPKGTKAYGVDAESAIRKADDLAEQAEAYIREFTSRELPPLVPKQRPLSEDERNVAARELARWIIKNLGHVAEGARSLDDYVASINAYLDPPKGLQELRDAVSTSEKGYEIHHIVEQTPAEKDKIPRSMIDAPENLVRIPRYKHWEITAWYQKKNDAYGGVSPRDYLRGKDWDERMKVGLKALMDHGVLKQ
jgi:hypothetical protein